MKVTFIYPWFEKFLDSVSRLNDEKKIFTVGKFTCPPSLGIPILASLTPPDVEVAFVDDNAGERLDFDDGTDLYAISCFTPQGTRALELARELKSRGKTVAMGGMFPSFMPGECLKYADCVNIGEGENTWPEIISDFKSGRLKKIYQSRKPVDMALPPDPRRDIFYGKESYDWDENLIQLTRGCAYNCAMCIIPRHMGSRLRFKPVEKAVAELDGMKHENVYLTDDSLFFPHRSVRGYAERFFREAAPLGRKFFVSSTMALNSDESFIKLAAKAGVRNFYCTMNVDPLSIRLLQGGREELGKFTDFKNMLEDNGIHFFASFGIGRDWDDASIAERVLDVCSHAKITTAEFFIFSPYPGSVHWDRLSAQNRITTMQWHKYNGANVVFKPAKMDADELYGKFVDCWKGFYEMNAARNLAAMEPTVWKGGEITITKSMEKRGVDRQAAISGIGIISPIGNDMESVRENLLGCRDGIRKASKIDVSPFLSNLCGEFSFDFSSEMSSEELETFTDPFMRLAISSARMALRDAEFEIPDGPGAERIALVAATCNAGLNSGEVEYREKHGDPSAKFSRSTSMQSEFCSVAKALACALKIRGETWVVNTACSGSTAAIGLAETLIETGKYDAVLVGGADAVALSNYAGFSAIKVVSPDKIAPFSNPPGMNIGEGAAFWLLENMGKALLRKAKCHGKVIGRATTGDAYHPTQPDPRGDGVFRTMRNAAADAGLKPSEIGCINAHASGTAANDRAEAKGVAKFLGGSEVPVTSTKSYTGHCMGATGILEATLQLAAMNAGFVPPTLRFSGPRPGCEGIFVPSEPLKKDYGCFLSSNYAFAGNNAAIVVAKRDFDFRKEIPNPKKIAITSFAPFTPAGRDAESLLEFLAGGGCAIAESGLPGTEGTGFSRAAMMPKIPARELDRRVDFSGMNPISTYATAAAKKALDSAGIRVSRGVSEDVSLTVCVGRGSDESEHMDAVFSTPERRGSVACFSNVTANSTAGWVSKALDIKGANITLTSGPGCSLQGIAYAAQTINSRDAKFAVALSADEVYAQQMNGYGKVGLILPDAEADDFRLRFSDDFGTVPGEGAAAFVLESEESAAERGAETLGTIEGWGACSCCNDFAGPNKDAAPLERAALKALEEAGMEPGDVGLVSWSPQGNAQDAKILEVCRKLFPGTPMATSVFRAGFAETSSAAVSLGACLESVKRGMPLWPQKTGLCEIDSMRLSKKPKAVIALSSSHIGNSYAMVVRPS